MTIPIQLALLIIGGSVTVLSTVLSGFVLAGIERKRTRIEREIAEIKTRLEFGKGQYQLASRKYDVARQTIAIVYSCTNTPEEHSPWLSTAMYHFYEAILYIHTAVSGEALPPEENDRRWKALLAEARKGNGEAMIELGNIYERQLNEWVGSDNKRVAERTSLEAEKSRLSARTTAVRNITHGAQVLGVLIALANDLVE